MGWKYGATTSLNMEDMENGLEDRMQYTRFLYEGGLFAMSMYHDIGNQ